VLVKRVYTVCDRVAADHPEIEILKAPYLSDHPLVLDCLLDRVTEMI
jgi:sirohydrochlorin cobaltochelatase